MTIAILLAASTPSGETPGSTLTRNQGFFSSDVGALLAVVLGLVAALFLAVKIGFMLRRRKRRQASRSRRQRREAAPRRRAEPLRRAHSVRNPTLAETEGLPPRRPEGQAPRHLEP